MWLQKIYYNLVSKSNYNNSLPVGHENSFEDESWNIEKYISMIETTKLEKSYNTSKRIKAILSSSN